MSKVTESGRELIADQEYTGYVGAVMPDGSVRAYATQEDYDADVEMGYPDVTFQSNGDDSTPENEAERMGVEIINWI